MRLRRCALVLGAGFLLASPFGSGQGWAQTETLAQPGQETSLADLRDVIEDRYEVLPVQDGIVLIPQYGATDVRTIELVNGEIAINAELVTGAELDERVGADAEPIRRLSFLDSATRRVLFGIGPSPETEAPEEEDADAVAAEPGADEEEETADVAPRRIRDVTRGSEPIDSKVRLGGSVVVDEDEVVYGEVVAVGGSVTIRGKVDGEVVAVGGSVRLGPNAVVEGDVVSVGGSIDKHPNAVVHGEMHETSFVMPDLRFQYGRTFHSPFHGLGGLISTVIWIIFLGILVALAYLLGRRPIERMEYRVMRSPWKAAVVGLVAQLLFLPVLVLVCVVLAISIVGIPLLLLVPFACLALVIGVLLGFTAVAKQVGRAAEERFGWEHENAYITLLVGVGLIMAISFFSAALGTAGGPLKVFAVLLGVLGIIVQYVAWTTGFGVLLLTRFGTRTAWSEEGPASPAAPPPPAPVGGPADEIPGEGAGSEIEH